MFNPYMLSPYQGGQYDSYQKMLIVPQEEQYLTPNMGSGPLRSSFVAPIPRQSGN